MTSRSMLIAGVSALLAIAISPQAHAAVVNHKCGAPISSTVKTELITFSTASTSFVNVPGASTTVSIPSGGTRCVKVRFSATASCSTTGSLDECVIRVSEPGIAFDPNTNGINFIEEQPGEAAHSFEWVKILGAGSHTITVEAGVAASPTNFSIGEWTMDVEVTK